MSIERDLAERVDELREAARGVSEALARGESVPSVSGDEARRLEELAPGGVGRGRSGVRSSPVEYRLRYRSASDLGVERRLWCYGVRVRAGQYLFLGSSGFIRYSVPVIEVLELEEVCEG